MKRKDDPLVRHYIVPLDRGGEDVPENYRLVPKFIEEWWEQFAPGMLVGEVIEWVMRYWSVGGSRRVDPYKMRQMCMAKEAHQLLDALPRDRMSGHHVWPRSRGGSKNGGNILAVPRNLHNLFHCLFDRMTVPEVIAWLVGYWGVASGNTYEDPYLSRQEYIRAEVRFAALLMDEKGHKFCWYAHEETILRSQIEMYRRNKIVRAYILVELETPLDWNRFRHQIFHRLFAADFSVVPMRLLGMEGWRNDKVQRRRIRLPHRKRKR